MLIEQPAGPGTCMYCGIDVSDLRMIESKTLEYIGEYCDGCAKRAKILLIEKAIAHREEMMGAAKVIVNIIFKLMVFGIYDE